MILSESGIPRTFARELLDDYGFAAISKGYVFLNLEKIRVEVIELLKQQMPP